MIPQTSKGSFATTSTVSETVAPNNNQPTTTKPEVSSTPQGESQQPMANAASPAREQKGYMEMGGEVRVMLEKVKTKGLNLLCVR